MAASLHFYEDTFNNLSSSLSTYVSDVASSIIAAITPVATTLITIYVVLWGWSMMRGVISEPITDGVSRIVRLAVITGIALNLGRYNGYLADMLWNSPDALAGYIASGYSNTTTNMQFLDSLMSQIYDLGDVYWQKAFAGMGTIGIPNIGLIIIAILIWAAGLLATAYGAFLLALSKMALAIILAVGPLFVLMTIFEPTRRFFDSWIGQALNYVFLAMLSAAAIKLVMTILQTYLTAAGGAGVLTDPSVSQALPAIVLCAIGMLVMMQLPSIASALGGGVAIGTLGAVTWAYGKAKGTTSGAWNVASGKTLSDIRATRRSKAMNARWAANNPGAISRAAGAPQAVYRKITSSGKNWVAKG